jgi:phosphatidylserine decarboxylase
MVSCRRAGTGTATIVAKSLSEWLDADVRPVRAKPLRWLSEQYFFRDPARPAYSDTSYFFSPADGIVPCTSPR